MTTTLSGGRSFRSERSSLVRLNASWLPFSSRTIPSRPLSMSISCVGLLSVDNRGTCALLVGQAHAQAQPTVEAMDREFEVAGTNDERQLIQLPLYVAASGRLHQEELVREIKVHRVVFAEGVLVEPL